MGGRDKAQGWETLQGAFDLSVGLLASLFMQGPVGSAARVLPLQGCLTPAQTSIQKDALTLGDVSQCPTVKAQTVRHLNYLGGTMMLNLGVCALSDLFLTLISIC